MFRCKECGTEYEIKPEYCDCGNDEFDEIIITKKQSEKPYIQQEIESKQTYTEQNYKVERLKKTFDPISTIIFLLCLIAGLFILFFVGNPEEKVDTQASKTTSENTQNLNLPSIDSIWNNSTVGIINNEKTNIKKTVAQQITKPQNTLQQKIEQEITAPKAVQQPIAPKTQTQTQTTQPAKQQTVAQLPKAQTTTPKISVQKQPQTQTTTTSKSKQTTVNKQQTITPNIPTKTQSIANQPKTTNTTQTTNTKPKTTSNTYTKTNSQPKTTTSSNTTTNKTNVNITTPTNIRPKATIDTQALKKELDNYKVGLRNTIGRKIEFTNVVGDGDCTISFKVASNGQITNRAFAKQSSNITLNDAVYKAVMATPRYNPPPSGYNNETMNLKIRFYNGNFDISLN